MSGRKTTVRPNVSCRGDCSLTSNARLASSAESGALRRVFEGVVAMCIAAGLVGGEAFSVDASLIKADVDKKKRVPGDQPSPCRRRNRHPMQFASISLFSMPLDRDDGGSSGGRRPKPPKE